MLILHCSSQSNRGGNHVATARDDLAQGVHALRECLYDLMLNVAQTLRQG